MSVATACFYLHNFYMKRSMLDLDRVVSSSPCPGFVDPCCETRKDTAPEVESRDLVRSVGIVLRPNARVIEVSNN